MLQQFAEVNQMFWNGSSFQWAFYACIVLILIFEKSKAGKVVFGIFPLIMLVGIFNPLTPVILRDFFHSVSLYYVRLFSVIPVFYCMAHGMILVLDKTRGGIKLLCVCAVSIGILLAGKAVFQEGWMRPAANAEKVPEEVLAVLDAIPHEKEDVCVAFPDPINNYARQIDAAIKMPYGRYVGYPIALLDELQKEDPDVAVLMSTAGMQGVDYIVISKKNHNRMLFSESGREPVGETQNWLIYQVNGVNHTSRTFNDKNQIIAVTNCDAENNPISNYLGYAVTEYEYNSRGDRIKETYIDRHGKTYTLEDGYAAIRKEYGVSGYMDAQTYLDENNQPVLVDGRFETKYEYDNNHRIIQESYYDQSGNKMNRTDTGYAVRDVVYDNTGRIIEERYRDSSGSLVNAVDGYAGFRREYDENDRLIQEVFYGESGQPEKMEDGCAGFCRTYDTSGNIVSETYLDVSGEPTARNGQYAVLKRRYDENQNLIEETYWDANGNPYELQEGYCSFYRIYDEMGDVAEERWNDAAGNETKSNSQRIVSFKDDPKLNKGATYNQTEKEYTFVTSLEDNRFSQVDIQLWDMDLNVYYGTIASENEIGVHSGTYTHKEKTGWYKLRLKGNSNLRDVAVDFEAFLQNGKEYSFTFDLETLEEKKICVSGFDFSGPCPWIMEQKLITDDKELS